LGDADHEVDATEAEGGFGGIEPGAGVDGLALKPGSGAGEVDEVEAGVMADEDGVDAGEACAGDADAGGGTPSEDEEA
jgi:hypothetical protein